VTPGLVRTEAATYGADDGAVAATVPMGRLAEPSDIAAACLLLASPRLGYTTGAELFVDGGGEQPSFHRALQEGAP
ncbi:MAG: SDR family oxidoreductase, partial [Actinomycetota bacterium]|nr:SDR family oxidoreductase [Actinomycetota bacterium]